MNTHNFSNKVKKNVKNTKFTLEERLKRVKKIYNIWLQYNHHCCSSSINIWFVKKWLYKYISKNSKMSKNYSKQILKNVFLTPNSKKHLYTEVNTRSVYSDY